MIALSRRLPPDDLRGPTVQFVLADFDHLERYPDAFRVTHVFCALGTTIRVAGSRGRFREVDFGYPRRVGELAPAAGARHYLLVSSPGASPRARGFSLRVTGGLEQAVTSLGFPAVTILRPLTAVRRPGGVPVGRAPGHPPGVAVPAPVSGGPRPPNRLFHLVRAARAAANSSR